MKLIKQIPNGLTLTNLTLGILSIIYIMESTELVEVRNLVSNEYHIIPNPIIWNNLAMASFLIIAAGIIDFLDGFVARLLNAQSEIGGQLDSLADLVTFCVAPSLIMYRLLGEAYQLSGNGLEGNTILLWPAFFIAICGCIRLAKFNISTDQTIEFKGLPTPSAAFFILALPLILANDVFNLNNIILNPYVLYAICIGLGLVMVGKFPLMALKFKSFNFKDNRDKFIFLGASLIGLITLQWLAIPIIIMIYLTSTFWMKRS